MDILHIINAERVERPEAVDRLPENDVTWLNFHREAELNWAQEVERLTGVVIHERHVHDSFNLLHPSFYDRTDSYEMLIFRGLGVEAMNEEFSSRPTVFIIIKNVLITISAADSITVGQVQQRLLDRSVRLPRRAAGVMHLLLTVTVDRFLALREPLTSRFEIWRSELLDPANPFDDWMTILTHTNYLRKLSHLCEEQQIALQAWIEDTHTHFDDHLNVRYMDLREHISRVQKFADEQKGEAESVVQLHFSAVAHRTNEIMRVLTVLSAIFLPLGLVAGIFGMNFEYMPELKIQYAYFFALGGMLGLAATLLVMFKIKRWI